MKEITAALERCKNRAVELRDKVVSAKATKESLEVQIKDKEDELKDLGIEDIEEVEEYLSKKVDELKEDVSKIGERLDEIEEAFNE